MKEFTIYAEGFVCMSVCSSLSPEETVERAHAARPTGIDLRWGLSQDVTFRTGQTNPCPCEDSPETHKHYLLNC